MLRLLLDDSVEPLRTSTSAFEIGVLLGREMVACAAELAPGALEVELASISRLRVVTGARTSRLPPACRLADDWISVTVLPPWVRLPVVSVSTPRPPAEAVGVDLPVVEVRASTDISEPDVIRALESMVVWVSSDSFVVVVD